MTGTTETTRAVLFDLDGTLMDTLGDIAAAMNAVLSANGFPRHPVNAYRHFVGDGMETLVRRTVPEPLSVDDAVVSRCLAAMKDEYRARMYDTTSPYPGIPELLGELAARGLALAVFSNKPDNFTREMTARYFGGTPFVRVLGLSDGIPRKPDPSGALLIAREAGISPASFLYLGDTATDMMTARGAGMVPVGAAWGFRGERELLEHGARHIVHIPWEVLRLIAP